ncbi:MAG: hypothetical protein EHM33_30205 [Chloroflexi bacterium]|nr:MAG: hypothetical protein EHM33_30205 [Chloroflexota bacterium]
MMRVKKADQNGTLLPVNRYTTPDTVKIKLLRKDNPKSLMSPSAKRFELYRTVKTVGEYRDLMRKAKTPAYANIDLTRDEQRGHIALIRGGKKEAAPSKSL